MIPALVLTAGLATRLRPLSLVRAKAAMPVAGEPLVRRILRWLHASGTTDVVLNLHHLPHTIARCLGDGGDLGLRVRYSWEVPLLGSAGGPRLATPIVGAGTFLIVNGDTLTDVPLEPLVEAHRRSGALVTMAVIPHPEPGKYGGIVTNGNDEFVGVAPRGAAEPSRHFVGVQVVSADAFVAVAAGSAAESVAEVYPALAVARPGSVRVHECRSEFFDIGTPADYLETSLLFARREHLTQASGRSVSVHATAAVSDSVIWDDVAVGEGARLDRCIVTDGVRVPARTTWSNVTLRPANGDITAAERIVHGLAVAPVQ